MREREGREGRWMKLKLLLRLVFHWVDEVWTENYESKRLTSNLWQWEMDNLFEILWDQERGPYQLFDMVVSWRVSFFILDSHELERQIFIHHRKSSLMRDVVMWRVNFSSTTWNHHHPRIYGDELERQIFIHWMNFLLLKDIWCWAGTSNIHPLDEFFTIEG